MLPEHGNGRRSYVQLGASRLWRPNLVRLKNALAGGSLVLWLGAGVSMPYGVPSWKELIVSLMLRLPPSSANRGRKGDDGWQGYYPQYRRALGTWMIDHFRFDPVQFARVFSDDPDLNQKIRDEIYAPLRHPPVEGSQNRRTSLDSVVDLIQAGNSPGSQPIRAVITLNYDDLLEEKLRRLGIEFTSVFKAGTSVNGLPIYHVHGYLPQDGPIPDQDLIFTEGKYHEISSTGFHWSVKTAMRHLHTHNVLFVGVSMIDPNLRRFLDTAHQDGEDPRHFVVREDYSVPNEEVYHVMDLIEKQARDFGREMGRAEAKRPEQLLDAIGDVCRKAHEYDKRTLKSLGVRPIWVRDRADICRVVDVIHQGIPKA